MEDGVGYEDVAGFCKSAPLEEIEKNGFVLTPGRYVGMADSVESGEEFNERISRLANSLKEMRSRATNLDEQS